MMRRDMADDELACQELVEIVTDYLEDALPADLRRRFERHLAGCPGCRVYLEQSEQTIRAARGLGVAVLSPADRAELLRLFEVWAQD
ncbi:MAG TPA: zf-HC2 domain-containing protein [Thermomicrobiales bacterium]|nr:zf-HC2 domain-containing protein [Thermomicrobiales bacterium]